MPEEKMSPSSPQLAIVEHQGVAVALSAKEVASIYKKSRQSGIPFDTLEEVYRRGYSAWTPELNETPTQTAFNRVNSFIAEGAAAAMDSDLINEKRGLWDNIHAKRERIKRGSGERMRKPGSKGAPTDAAIKASQTEESDPCWDGYKQVGMKTKKGRKVPNCVPEERYMGAEKASNDPNNPMSRFDGDARVYVSGTPGQESAMKYIGGSKLKTIKRVVKEACSCENKKTFKREIEEGDRTSVRSSDVKDIVMNSPYGPLVKLSGLEKRLEPKTVEAYARSVGIPVSGGVIGSNRPQSASRLSQNIKKVYNYDVSPESIKGYANKFGLSVAEAYEMLVSVIIKEENDAEHHAGEKEMAKTQLKAIAAKANNLASKMKGKDLEAWMQSKIATAKDGISAVNDVMTYREETEIEEDAKGHKSPSGGLTQKGRDYYNRTTGSNLKAPVTTKPSKLKKGSKAANRRKSFCARMGGMKKRLTSAKTARDPNSRINKALRKWNC